MLQEPLPACICGGGPRVEACVRAQSPWQSGHQTLVRLPILAWLSSVRQRGQRGSRWYLAPVSQDGLAGMSPDSMLVRRTQRILR